MSERAPIIGDQFLRTRKVVLRAMSVFVLLISALTIIAFLPGLQNEFLNWDDDRNFLDNPDYRGVGLEQLRWGWRTYHLGVWQPLSWLILGLQYEAAELDPRIYHGLSLALHALTAVAFFGLTALLVGISGAAAPPRSAVRILICAAAAGVLFAVHPLRVEPVAWISAQPYLPAAFFYVAGVTAYTWGHHRGTADGTPWRWLALTFTCYCLAVGSKAVAVTMPAVLLILDVYPLRRLGSDRTWKFKPAARALGEKIPFFAVAVGVSLLAAGAKDYSDSRVPFHEFDADARLAQSAYGLVFYLVKSIAPHDLSPYYRLPEDLSLSDWPYGPAALLGLALTLVLFRLRRRAPSALAAWCAYVIILLPNLGIVQISQQMATDRYSYVAIMPPMILLAGGLEALLRSRRGRRLDVRIALLLAGVATATGLTIASRRQVRIWRDSETLWRATLDVDPRCAVAECQLGQAVVVKGMLDEGVRRFRRAVDLKPEFAFAHSNLGATLLARARLHDPPAVFRAKLEAAVRAFERALRSADLRGLDRAKTHAGLGAACAGLGRYGQAKRHTEEAQRLGLVNDNLFEMVRRLEELSGRDVKPPGS